MKKFLYLVRHAKSSWDNPDLSDFERPLNSRGKRDAPKMGKRLKERQIKPDLIICSPAKRAKKTATKISKQINYDQDDIIYDSGLYHADPDTILEIVQQQPGEIESLMIFGHNPGFTEFANSISGMQIDNIPTAGLFVASFTVSQWSEIRFGTGNFELFDYPKKAF